jgi:hypothetical protein
MICLRNISVDTLPKGDIENDDDDDDNDNNNNDKLHFNICKETGIQLDKNTGANMFQNQ